MHVGQSTDFTNHTHHIKDEQTKDISKLSTSKVEELKTHIEDTQKQIAINAFDSFKNQFHSNTIETQTLNIQEIEKLNFEETPEFKLDGYYGVEQTSSRISDFVINASNNNIDMLRAGKSGVINGFEEAQKIMGDKMPQISEDTFNQAIENINDHISKLGFNILDIKV